MRTSARDFSPIHAHVVCAFISCRLAHACRMERMSTVGCIEWCEYEGSCIHLCLLNDFCARGRTCVCLCRLTSCEFGAMCLCLSFDKLCACGRTRVRLWYLAEFCACVLCLFCARLARFVAHGRSVFFPVDQQLWARHLHSVTVSGVCLQSRYDEQQHPLL